MQTDDPAPNSSGEDQESAPLPPVVAATTDPGIANGRTGNEAGDLRPDETVVAETSKVTRAVPGYVSQASPFVESKRADSGGRSKDEGPKNQEPGDHKKEHTHRPAWMSLALTAVLAIVCGVGGAWGFSHFDSSKNKNKDKDQAKGGEQSKEGSGGSSKKGDSSTGQDQGQGGNQASGDPHSDSPKSMASEESAKSKEQIQQLNARFSTLQQRVDALATPRDVTPPDLNAIRVRLGELSRKVDEVGSLPERARRVEDRLDRLREEVKALSDQLSAASPRGVPVGASSGDADRKVESITPPPSPPPPPSSPTTDASPADDAMAEGISLFKKGQYSRADEIFRKLQTTKPKDARVWYFSALAHGFATGHWDGETRLFVVQGADREREGMPPTPRIDSAFAELSPAQGKDWLASYRSQLLNR